MPLTYTGRRVKPAGLEHPSLVDIAVGLSRAPRFAGQTRRWFSVLDHSLFVDEMVKQRDEDGIVVQGWGVFLTPKMRLAVLLHDAHESMTGDIPTDWKGEDMKTSQVGLDHKIMEAFFPGGIKHYNNFHTMVKHFDRRALVAEAQVIGPPATKERILELFGTTEDTPMDIELLNRLLPSHWVAALTRLGQPPFEYDQGNHPTVKEYLKRLLELM